MAPLCFSKSSYTNIRQLENHQHGLRLWILEYYLQYILKPPHHSLFQP